MIMYVLLIWLKKNCMKKGQVFKKPLIIATSQNKKIMTSHIFDCWQFPKLSSFPLNNWRMFYYICRFNKLPPVYHFTFSG